MKMTISLLLFVLLICMIPLKSQELDTLVLDSSVDIAQQILDDVSESGERNPDRIYILEKNKMYFFKPTLKVNEETMNSKYFHLRIAGKEDAPIFEIDTISQMPIVIHSLSEHGDITWFELNSSIISLKNIIFIGDHEGIQLQNYLKGLEHTQIDFKNCVISEAWESLFKYCKNLTISNCYLVNNGPSFSLDYGYLFQGQTDTLIFENNTVASFGMFTWNKQMPHYMRVNHNTFINQSGAFSPEFTEAPNLIWANNLHYNIGFAGRTESDRLEDPDGLVPGYFDWDTTGIDTADWRILFTNNQTRLDSLFREYYASTEDASDPDQKVHEMPFFNTRALASADRHAGIQIQNTFEDVDPQFKNYIDNVDSLIQFLKDVRSDPQPEWITNRHYPPILDYDTWEVNWPPELDLSYTNTDLLTAGTDGLPLGDLNWFPEQKEIWEANKDRYTADLEEMLNNPVGVDEIDVTPSGFGLFQNYPNPFNPSTVISYQLSNATKVRLEVFDITGRSVKMLVDESQHPGHYRVAFDGTGLPSGVYFARLSVNDRSDMRKMMLVR